MRILTQIQQERITNFESEISKLRENLRDCESQINAKEVRISLQTFTISFIFTLLQ
jgi:hypothetical protein